VKVEGTIHCKAGSFINVFVPSDVTDENFRRIERAITLWNGSDLLGQNRIDISVSVFRGKPGEGENPNFNVVPVTFVVELTRFGRAQ
jgi:hypothetical protein